MAWWIKFSDGTEGCVELVGDERPQIGPGPVDWTAHTVEYRKRLTAKAEAVGHGTPLQIDQLPYPANPRLGLASNCPSFCSQPAKCLGRGSCPRSYACSE